MEGNTVAAWPEKQDSGAAYTHALLWYTDLESGLPSAPVCALSVHVLALKSSYTLFWCTDLEFGLPCTLCPVLDVITRAALVHASGRLLLCR